MDELMGGAILGFAFMLVLGLLNRMYNQRIRELYEPWSRDPKFQRPHHRR